MSKRIFFDIYDNFCYNIPITNDYIYAEFFNLVAEKIKGLLTSNVNHMISLSRFLNLPN